MNKKKTIVLVVIAILVIVAAIIGICIKRNKGNINSDNPSNVNSGENITNKNNDELPTTYIDGEKTLDDLTFKNIKFILEEENQCMFEADVSNNGDEKVNSTVLNVELLDGSGDSIGVLGVELPEVDSKSTSKLKMSIAVDVMHTRDVKFSFAE